MDAKKSLKIKIVTPTKVVFEGTALEISVNALDGRITILPDHAPLVTALDVGFIELKFEDGTHDEFLNFEGLLMVKDNRVKILTDEVDVPSEDLIKEIEEAIESAKKGKPTTTLPVEDLIKAEQELKVKYQKELKGE